MNPRKPSLIIDTYSVEQTVTLGATIGRSCKAGDVIALQGELGAGKTQLVRGLAEGMGLNPRQVSSPTFVMVQEYEPTQVDSDRPVLVHIDAYRIKSEEDLVSIGWHGRGEELRDQAVVAVEWAALIEPALGEDVLWLHIEHTSDGRRVSVSARGDWAARMPVMEQSLRESRIEIVEGAKP